MILAPILFIFSLRMWTGPATPVRSNRRLHDIYIGTSWTPAGNPSQEPLRGSKNPIGSCDSPANWPLSVYHRFSLSGCEREEERRKGGERRERRGKGRKGGGRGKEEEEERRKERRKKRKKERRKKKREDFTCITVFPDHTYIYKKKKRNKKDFSSRNFRLLQAAPIIHSWLFTCSLRCSRASNSARPRQTRVTSLTLAVQRHLRWTQLDTQE